VKITPAHDPNDFEVGIRHNLQRIRVMEDDATMSKEAGKFAGMDRFECRSRLVLELEEGGALVKVEDHFHAVGHCYRCKTVVEPSVSKQWFVSMRPLAEPAIEAVRKGKVRIIPKGWENTYFDWMENIRDWCISRQIWWGHRIPAWHCASCGELTVSREDPVVCHKCGSRDILQDPDVLDTWFSSALWPFSTMGWPDKTPEVDKYYPTTVLVTAFDILFFWVARMIMMGIKVMKKPPFADVYIHALVRDAQGQKMSKSKGNVIDPLVMIDKYGTDAFRFTMVAMAAQGRDVKLSEERIEGYRNFCNKIWNAARFTLMNVGEFEAEPLKEEHLTYLPDKWVVERLNLASRAVNEALEDYRFDEAAGRIYQFFWREFCDWYLELIKPVLFGTDEAQKGRTLNVLVNVFEASMRLLHPFMPFITEEVWQSLPMRGKGESIMVASFTDKNGMSFGDSGFGFTKEAEQMQAVMTVIDTIRNIRGELNVAPSLEISAVVKVIGDTDWMEGILSDNSPLISKLARLKYLEISRIVDPPRQAAKGVTPDTEVYVPFEGLVDIDAEVARLQKEIDKTDKELKPVAAKLENESFTAKAPADVVEKTRGILAELSAKKEKLEEGMRKLEGMKG